MGLGSFFKKVGEKVKGLSRRETDEAYVRYTPDGILQLVDELLSLSKEELKSRIDEYSRRKERVPLALALAYSIREGNIYLSAGKAAEIGEGGRIVKVEKEYLELRRKSNDKLAEKAIENLGALCSHEGEVHDVMKKLKDIVYKHWKREYEEKLKQEKKDVISITEEKSKPSQYSPAQTPSLPEVQKRVEEKKEEKKSERTEYVPTRPVGELQSEKEKEEMRKKEGSHKEETKTAAVALSQYSKDKDRADLYIKKMSETFRECFLNLYNVRGLLKELESLAMGGQIKEIVTSKEKSFVWDRKESEVVKKVLELLPEEKKDEVAKKLWYVGRLFKDERKRGDAEKLAYELLSDVTSTIYSRLDENAKKLAEKFVTYVLQDRIGTTSRGGVTRSDNEAERVFNEVYNILKVSANKGENVYKTIYDMAREIRGKNSHYESRSSSRGYGSRHRSSLILIFLAVSSLLVLAFLNLPSTSGFFVREANLNIYLQIIFLFVFAIALIKLKKIALS